MGTMDDDCILCGERIQFMSIDGSREAYHHVRHDLDADHPAYPSNPTFRYLIRRWEGEPA